MPTSKIELKSTKGAHSAAVEHLAPESLAKTKTSRSYKASMSRTTLRRFEVKTCIGQGTATYGFTKVTQQTATQ
jgi:hypothetical protein